MYKAKLIKDGTIFLGKTQKELASKLNTTVRMVDDWLRRGKGKDYIVLQITKEEYDKELDEQRKTKSIRTIIQPMQKINNQRLWVVFKDLSNKRLQALQQIKEEYADSPKKMELMLIAKKQQLQECTHKEFPQYKFVWNETNNNYKKI